MSTALDRSGIFKCRVLAWSVKQTDSGSVAVTLKLLVLSQLNGLEWVSWEEAEEHVCYGDFWVVKKDGTVNTAAVEQLATSLGWDGNLSSVIGEPPSVVVQATVKEDTYNGVTRYKASWINPEDYAPTPAGESAEDVKVIQAKYGSLLRAAAAGATKAKAAKPPAKKQTATTPSGDDDIPF